jgi:hypothetical protein
MEGSMAKRMDRYLEITRHLRQEVLQRRRGAKESPPWSCKQAAVGQGGLVRGELGKQGAAGG